MVTWPRAAIVASCLCGGCDPVVVDAIDVPDGGPPPEAYYASLLHRYSFNGSGEDVIDSVGEAHGRVVGDLNAQALGDVFLSGAVPAYVELPGGMLSSLQSATLQAWVTWAGGAGWQRIFDFGDSVVADTGEVVGRSYLFATPGIPPALGSAMRAVHRESLEEGQLETIANGARALPANVSACFSVVVDADAERLSLYVEDALEGATRLRSPLSLIVDDNAWLGRSLFERDPYFAGRFHEFRIYGAALGPEQIGQSCAEGRDATF